MDNKEKKTYSVRLTGFSAVIIIIFLVLGFNLWRLQIAQASYYAEMAEGNYIKTVATSAVRGPIVDSNGVVLARSVPKFSLFFDWADMQKINEDWKDVIRKLAVYLKPYWEYPNESPELIAEDIFVMIRHQQENSYRPLVVMEDITPRLQAVIAEHSNELPGVSVEPVPVREYKKDTLAGQVLGYVREISEQELQQLNEKAEENGDGYRYEPGDFVGKMGVEKSYDSWLRGTHGIDRVGVDSSGRPIVQETIREAQPGATVQLTIDSELQAVVENELDRVIKVIQKNRNENASAGGAVLIDVKTGKVLAMASRPFMNPNDLTGVISDEMADRYFRNRDAASFNRALSGLYPPGSTFKMITGMAALEAGVVTPNDYFNDSKSSLGPPSIQAQGVSEWGGNYFGRVNLYRGLAVSSNIYFQIVGRRVFEKEPELIRKICHEFGLGVETGIDIPGEAAGIAPSPDWKEDYFKPYYDRKREEQLAEINQRYEELLNKASDEKEKERLLREKDKEIARVEIDYEQNLTYHVDWRVYDSFYNSIGQGYNSYTLLQMANYVATIANGGTHYQPYIVDKIIDTLTGQVVKENKPNVRNKASVSQETLANIKLAMSKVTSGEGTASWLFWDVPEFSGGGKTGTAQIGSKNTAFGTEYNGMFVAFAPYEDPQVAFAGAVEYGGHGGDTAGYVAKAAFKHYFGW